jgi:hypothetical protein
MMKHILASKLAICATPSTAAASANDGQARAGQQAV